MSAGEVRALTEIRCQPTPLKLLYNDSPSCLLWLVSSHFSTCKKAKKTRWIFNILWGSRNHITLQNYHVMGLSPSPRPVTCDAVCVLSRKEGFVRLLLFWLLRQCWRHLNRHKGKRSRQTEEHAHNAQLSASAQHNSVVCEGVFWGGIIL